MPLFFCRHGETLWNRQGLLQGTFDSPLTDLGREQARQAGSNALAFDPELIYCSELPRARNSAQLANQKLQLPIVTSPLLNERCFGELQGRRRHLHPQWWQAYQQRHRGDAMAIPGAEAATAVARRIDAFMELTQANHPGTRILVIGHGEWQKICLNLAWGSPPWCADAPLPDNGRIWSLEELGGLPGCRQTA